MASTVYVIGAGCSLSYYEDHNSSISGLKCPLDGNFFKMANILLMHEPLLNGKLHLLKTRLKELFGFEIDNLEPNSQLPGLEEVTTILDLEAKQSGDLTYIDLMLDLISVVIWKALPGSTSKRHRMLAGRINANDSVISFNYDLLLDNALLALPSEGAYRLNFDWVFDGTWRRSSGAYSGIEFLKLHGSLNWLRCGNCGSVLLYHFKALPRLVYERLGLVSPSGDFNCPKCNRSRLSSSIIPPLLTKQLDDIELKYIWNLARKRLAAADKIVVIGYSLPPTDYQTELLLRKSRSDRIPSELQLDIVNPDCAIVKRFLHSLRPTKYNYFVSLKNYFALPPKPSRGS